MQANKASILAVITNKLGDIALLISCTVMYSMFKTVDFAMISACAGYFPYISSEVPAYAYFSLLYTEETIVDFQVVLSTIDRHMLFDQLTLVCFFLLVAAIGKSAQAGLHIWLPEAMEGPTPVSSLIHAATMVTAGIFLLLRCSYLFFDMSTMFIYIIFFGSITAFFSSTIGLLQTDIKKVVAYSTCSQLGYMFICCGFSAYGNGIYHLFNHAFFKALLFLTAGYVIHALSNEQDIRKMGSLLTILPFSYIMMLIGSLSLIGFPFFSGFYSKDRIVELCFNNYLHFFSMFASYKYIMFSQILCIFAVIFTLVYSMKLLFFVFFNSYCGFKYYLSSMHYSSFFIQVPLLFLSVLSMISGYFTSDMMVGIGSSF